MARVTLGGTEYEIPRLNFDGLERAWPFIEEATMTLHPMKGPAAGIAIIAAGLVEAEHFKPTDFGIEEDETLGEDQRFERVVRFLKKKTLATDIEDIRRCVEQITEEAGLEKAESGEALTPPGEESPSTETAATTSPSSPPPAAVEETTVSSESDTALQSTTSS